MCVRIDYKESVGLLILCFVKLNIQQLLPLLFFFFYCGHIEVFRRNGTAYVLVPYDMHDARVVFHILTLQLRKIQAKIFDYCRRSNAFAIQTARFESIVKNSAVSNKL